LLRAQGTRHQAPPVPAPQIGTRFVLRASIAGHEQKGRTLWIDLRRADIALMADMPAVPDPEDLVELIEAVERDGLRAIIRYELADGALTQSGRPIAMLRAIEHDGASVTGMDGPLRFPFAHPGRPTRAVELSLGRGIAHLEAQRPEPAIRLLTQALAGGALSDAARILALRSRGQAQQYLVEDGRNEPTTESDRTLLAAIRDFRAWQALEPASLDPLDREADILQSLGAYDEALAIYRRLRDEQQDGWFWPSIKIAATYRLMGDHLRALGTLDELARRPRGWEGMTYRFHRGWTLVRLGRYADAEATFTVGLESQPDFGWAHVGRACARSAQGKLADALADLDHAIADLEPPDGISHTPQQQRALEQTRKVAQMLRGVVAKPAGLSPKEPCSLFLEALDRPRARSPELQKLQSSAPSAHSSS
jgi:tetratricopeptide (TPR) repeat protein